MTRARALKAVIRARAEKTGERYTTARRHVLKEISLSVSPAPAAPPTPARSAPVAPPAPASKGGLSDAKARDKTGHGFDHWFAVLDRFGGAEKGHTAMARHLFADHGVPGWHSQGITVAYERARGIRDLNQRCDGAYEVSVSKVVNATTQHIARALTEPAQRKRWTREVDPALVNALATALVKPGAKGVVVRPDNLGTLRYKWGETSVQLYIAPKPGGKVSVVATNGKLADAAMVETRRAIWRKALESLAATFAAASRSRV